jgi:hypothetical protein
MSDFDRIFDQLNELKDEGAARHQEVLQRLTKMETQMADARSDLAAVSSKVDDHDKFQSKVKGGFTLLGFANLGVAWAYLKAKYNL